MLHTCIGEGLNAHTMSRHIHFRDCRMKLRQAKIYVVGKSVLGEKPLVVFNIFKCSFHYE
jgi:hypothetical protein